MSEITIKRHEDGTYGFYGPGIGSNGETAKEALHRAARLRCFDPKKGAGAFFESILAPESEFKVGDLVRWVDERYRDNFGKTGRVVEISGGGEFVSVEGIDGSWYPSRFELVEEDVKSYELNHVVGRVFYGGELCDLLDAGTTWIEETGATPLSIQYANNFEGDGLHECVTVLAEI